MASPMAVPDILDLTDDELRQVVERAGTELSRRIQLASAPAMVADILVGAHVAGGDLAQIATEGRQLAEDQIAEQETGSN